MPAPGARSGGASRRRRAGLGPPDLRHDPDGPAERPLWLLATLVLVGLYMGVVSALRPMVSYRAIEIGAPPVALGIIASCFAIVALVVAIPVGRWVDRFGEVRFLRLGSALLAVDAFAILVLRTTWGLAASQALLGLGQVQVVVAGQALMAKRGAPGGRERRVRLFSVAVAVGQLVGPVTAGVLAGSGKPGTVAARSGLPGGDIQVVFAACGAVATVAAAIAFALPAFLPAATGRASTSPGGSTGGSAAIRTVLRRPGMLPMLLAGSATTATADLLTAYLPAYAVARQLPVAFVGFLLSLRAGSILGARMVMGRLLHRIRHGSLLVTGLLVAGVSCAAISLTGSGVALALLMLGVGLGQGFGQPITIAWVAEQAPAERRALALGVRVTVNRFGQLVVPTAAGILAGVAGLPAAFVAAGALLAGSGALASTAAVELGVDEDPGEVATV